MRKINFDKKYFIGQYSSEGDPDVISHKPSDTDAPNLKRLVTEGSLASVVSMRSESRLKSLMRDELLINAQKFSSQVQRYYYMHKKCVTRILC